MAKRIHWLVISVPPQKTPVMPCSLRRGAVFFEPAAQGVEQLGGREHALDVVLGRKDGERLVDDVFLIGLEVLHPAFLDDLDDPARIEIDAEADAAAELARCSTARRSRRGPDGPSMSQLEPLGKY